MQHKLNLIATTLILFVVFLTSLPRNASALSRLDLSVALDPVLSLGIVTSPSEINLEDGDFGYTSMTISVSTNNLTGYTLFMANNDGVAELATGDTHNPGTIENLEASTSAQSFPEGYWGYSKTNSAYLPIPLASSPSSISSSEGTVDDDRTTIYFGAKVSSNFPGGEYRDAIVFSAIANPIPENRTLFDIRYMQDVNSTICLNTPTPLAFIDNNSENGILSTLAESLPEITFDAETNLAEQVPSVTLIDERDEQEYTVRKLADGNCWMSENLRLGSNAETLTLTSKLSDLATGRTFTLPMATTADGVAWERLAETPFAYNKNSASYGNLYNWYTATAGARDNNGTSLMTTTGVAADSICPKNWQLPAGHQVDPSKGYVGLFNSYGLPVYANDEDAQDEFAILRNAPFDFTASGIYYFTSARLEGRSGSGYYVASDSQSNASFEFLYLAQQGIINARNGAHKDNAMSVRCLVK